MNLQFKIIATLLLFVSNPIFSQNLPQCNVVTIKGYLIIEAYRKEIKEIKRLSKKNKIILIDREDERYFLPCDTNESFSEILKTKDRILSSKAYIFQDVATASLLKKYCGFLSDDSVKYDSKIVFDSEDWFFRKETPEKVYQVFYLETKAVNVLVENNSYNEAYLNLRYRIDKKERNIDCYFFTQPIVFFPTKPKDMKKLK